VTNEKMEALAACRFSPRCSGRCNLMKCMYLLFAIACGELVEALRALHASWWTCLVLSVAAFAGAILLIEIRNNSVEAVRQLEEQIETQSDKLHQRKSEESERRSVDVAEEFRLFARLAIAPTDEWRLRLKRLLERALCCLSK